MKDTYTLLTALSLILAVLLGYQLHSYTAVVEQTSSFQPQQFLDETSRIIAMKLPAVDRNGKGAIAELTLEVTKGNGRAFLRIDRENPLTNPDTQISLKTALEVGKKVARRGFEGKNFYYSFSTDAEAVAGQSAGAALTIATIAALKNENLKQDVSITGTIEPDGSIGSVGKVFEKAKALKKNNHNVFLVPKGDARVVQELQECETEVIGPGVYRRCVSRLVQVDIEKEVGIKVIEVSNIEQAYELMGRAK